MGVKFTNNASTTLTSAVAINDTTISVADASSFPDISSSGYYYVTIGSEVIKVTSISGTTLTIVAATAVHTSGSGVEIRVAAEILEDIRTETTNRAISDSTSTTSSVINASSTAVKAAYDVGNHSHPYEAADATILKESEIVDNLTSTSTSAPLSANQGKTLKTSLDTKASTGKAIAMAMVFG